MTTVEQAVNLLFKNETDGYIFIYTPPKVGSTTLVTSLRVSLGKSFNIIHIHDETMLRVLTGIQHVSINDIIHYLAQLGKQVFVIDVFRTPIERKISEFFEKIAPYHFNNTETNIASYPMPRIVKRFNQIFPFLENGDHSFDYYGITPVPFDFSRKYTVQLFNKVTYIKLRLADSHLWAQILSTIFKLKIVLISDYTTKNKDIGNLYSTFMAEYKIPSNFLDDIRNSTFLQFYYSHEERCKYLDSWASKMAPPFVPFSSDQFNFYIQLCFENKYINDLQTQHYIDNGCFCKECSRKRRDIYFLALSGHTQFDKIIHSNTTPLPLPKFPSNLFKIKT